MGCSGVTITRWTSWVVHRIGKHYVDLFDPATIRVHARWHQACGQWTEAVAAWLDSIDRDPMGSYGYQRVWECSAGFAAEQRREVWERIEPILLRSPGHLAIARDTAPLLAQRFGVIVAEEAVSRWNLLRPDDPEIAESFADLLLERCGDLRSQAKSNHASDAVWPSTPYFSMPRTSYQFFWWNSDGTKTLNK